MHQLSVGGAEDETEKTVWCLGWMEAADPHIQQVGHRGIRNTHPQYVFSKTSP